MEQLEKQMASLPEDWAKHVRNHEVKKCSSTECLVSVGGHHWLAQECFQRFKHVWTNVMSMKALFDFAAGAWICLSCGAGSYEVNRSRNVRIEP